jgi:DNA repair exonuclease SbcCD nuclease subunit
MKLARLLTPLLFAAAATNVVWAQLNIAQISDIHIGEKRAPHAVDNLRKTVDMINERHPDAVIVSGDVGEKHPQDWDTARGILKWLHAPVYYAPGNHDVHADDVQQYRQAFGKDYFRFSIKNVDFIVIDSELLGNFDQYNAKSPPPMSPATEKESGKMLDWLNDEARHPQSKNRVVIGIQHVPGLRDGDFPDPQHPYWVINDPYRGREIEVLHKLGIRHMLVGHWHNPRVFEGEGITWHVAPATSWLPWGGHLGFAMHTISPDGNVKTEFVNLPDAEP